jgi:hypothetical protein
MHLGDMLQCLWLSAADQASALTCMFCQQNLIALIVVDV